MRDGDYQLLEESKSSPSKEIIRAPIGANDFYDNIEVEEEIQPEAPENHAVPDDLRVDIIKPIVLEKPDIIYIKPETLANIRNFSKCLSAFTAFYDASGIILSLNDMEEMSDDTLTKALGLSINHLFFVIPVFYAIPSFDINYPSIVDGLKMAISFYYSHASLQYKSPCCGYDGFNCCNRFRSVIASFIILLIACFASAADGLVGDYFVLQIATNPILLWKIFSIICSVPVAITTLLTETPELFSYFCSNINDALLPVLEEGEVYAAKEDEEKIELNSFIQFIDTFIGNYLRIFGGIELALEVYVALIALANPDKIETQYFLFAVSFLRSSTNFFFYGKKGLDTVDALFTNLAQGGPSLKQFIILLISVVPVSLVADCLRELYRKFLTDPSTELPFDCPSAVVEFIAVHTAVFEGVVLLGATIDLLTRGVLQIQQLPSRLYSACFEVEAKEAQGIPINADIKIDEEKQEPEAPELIVIEMSVSSKKKAPAIQVEDNEQPLIDEHERIFAEENKESPNLYVPPVFQHAGHRNAFFPLPPTPTAQDIVAPQPSIGQKISLCNIL